MKTLGTVALALAVASCVPDAPPELDEVADTVEPAGAGSGSSNGNNGSSITPLRYLERIAEIQCEQAFGCRATYPGTPVEFETTWGTSIPACTADLVVAWNTGSIENDIAKGRIAFDGSAAVACLGGVAFGACAEHWERGIQWADACYSVLVGTAATGDMCETSYACASYSCDTAARRCL